MSPGDHHRNVSQIRFDIQLKTKAPLGDPHPRSFILSEVVISVFPGLPSLSGVGGWRGMDFWLWTCSVIKQLSLLGLCHVLNTLLSVVHECVWAATVWHTTPIDAGFIRLLDWWAVFHYTLPFPRIGNLTFSFSGFYVPQSSKASEIAFKLSCDADSHTRTNSIILDRVASED